MNISVCIITKNEALKLKKCLASLKRYDVEIVVVDTGSTDETLQVIEEYADIKGNYKWNDNFAEARNYSITLANNEWILVLDSDEWIESADMNLINSILLQSDGNIVGRIERINDINLSDENVKGTERISRLFNKKYCHYEGRIHEQVVSINGDEIETIDVPITAGHSLVSLRLNTCVSPHELKSMIASAPMSTALFTFSISMSRSVQSLDVPRLTFIFVLSFVPIPLGFKHL